MRERKPDEYREVRKPKTFQMIYPIDQPCSIIPLAEALGEMSLPLSLEIVGTDRSHPEAGAQGADLIACRSVANDSPILGRLFALLAWDLCVAPGSVSEYQMVMPVDCGWHPLQIAVLMLWLGVYEHGCC